MDTILAYNNLYLEFTQAEIIAIEKLWICEEFNRHGTAKANLVVLTEKEYRFIDDITANTKVKMILKQETGMDCIFIGFVSNITVKKLEMVYQAELELISTTYLLDYKLVRRSFQDKDNPYSNLFQTVAETDGQAYVYCTDTKVQEESIIQYDETNWQFILRLVSKLGKKVIPNVESEFPYIRIGVQDGEEHQEVRNRILRTKNRRESSNL